MITIATTANAHAATAVSAAAGEHLATYEIQTPAADQNAHAITVPFDQQVLPLGDNRFLRLWRQPTVKVHTDRWEYEVEGWGLTVRQAEVVDIPRELGRQFLRLWRRSQDDLLDDQERHLWSSIVDQVDTVQFAVDQAQPRYIEALLTDKETRPQIRLHSGEIARLPSSAYSSLSLVNKGEWFGAFARFDRDGVLVAIERAIPIGSLPSEEEMDKWPPLLSE